MKALMLFIVVTFTTSSYSNTFKELYDFLLIVNLYEVDNIKYTDSIVVNNFNFKTFQYDNLNEEGSHAFKLFFVNNEIKSIECTIRGEVKILNFFNFKNFKIANIYDKNEKSIHPDFVLFNPAKQQILIISPVYTAFDNKNNIYLPSGSDNIQFITAVDSDFMPIYKHYFDNSYCYASSNFVYTEGRVFEEIGIINTANNLKTKLGGLSVNTIFNDFNPLPSLNDPVLILQREINYDNAVFFWFTAKFLETVHYDTPNSIFKK